VSPLRALRRAESQFSLSRTIKRLTSGAGFGRRPIILHPPAMISSSSKMVGGTGKAQPSSLKDLSLQTSLRVSGGTKGVLRNTYKPYRTLTPKQRARHAEVARHYTKAKKQWPQGPQSVRIARVRLRELERVYFSHYGYVLPDDQRRLAPLA
jgi:hypothetical protein